MRRCSLAMIVILAVLCGHGTARADLFEMLLPDGGTLFGVLEAPSVNGDWSIRWAWYENGGEKIFVPVGGDEGSGPGGSAPALGEVQFELYDFDRDWMFMKATPTATETGTPWPFDQYYGLMRQVEPGLWYSVYTLPQSYIEEWVEERLNFEYGPTQTELPEEDPHIVLEAEKDTLVFCLNSKESSVKVSIFADGTLQTVVIVNGVGSCIVFVLVPSTYDPKDPSDLRPLGPPSDLVQPDDPEPPCEPSEPDCGE